MMNPYHQIVQPENPPSSSKLESSDWRALGPMLGSDLSLTSDQNIFLYSSSLQ